MNARARALLALFLATIFLFTSIPQEAEAFPFRIQGFLKDENGAPIPLANITLVGEVYDLSIQDFREGRISVLTDSSGYYQISPGVSEPNGFDDGSTGEIIYYLSNGDEGASTTITFSGLRTWANITYEEEATPSEIILSPVGIVSIVVIITLIFVVVYYIRLPENEEEETVKNQRNVGRRRDR